MWPEALATIKAWKQARAAVFWASKRFPQGQGGLGVMMSSGCWVR